MTQIKKNTEQFVNLPALITPTGDLAVDATVTAADIRISLNGAPPQEFDNANTLTVVGGTATPRVQLSAAESNVETILIVAQDQSDPVEWLGYEHVIDIDETNNIPKFDEPIEYEVETVTRVDDTVVSRLTQRRPA